MRSDDDKVFRESSFLLKAIYFMYDFVDKPITWFRESIVEANNNQENVWYHEKVRRVPTVDECYTHDEVCIYEADEQYQRDKLVESNIIKILKRRHDRCLYENKFDEGKCGPFREKWIEAVNNFFIKHGDLGYTANAINCYMKQKHRMAFERRHGPVGSGRKAPEEGLSKKSKC